MAAVVEAMHGDSLFADLPIRVQKEGNRARIGDSEMNYVKISAAQSLPARIAEGMAVPEFFAAAEAIGKQLGEQQAKHLFEKIRQPSSAGAAHLINITEETTFDEVLALWDKMEVRFVRGMPHWPSIVSNPHGVALIRGLIERAQEDPPSREKWRLLLDKKQREFNEREARRRLVE